MAFDYKKEFKELYMPKTNPEIVVVPKMNYIAVTGVGNPNEANGAYQEALGVLYAVAYTLKMSSKGSRKIAGFFEYVVPPLEGFWWQEGIVGVDYSNKQTFNWVSVIRLPDFICEEDVNWAVAEAQRKKKLDCSLAKFWSLDEGMCVQCMHAGDYDSEPQTVELMHRYAAQNGYAIDIHGARMHHEIYLSDPRKTPTDRLKTVIRHPIKKV